MSVLLGLYLGSADVFKCTSHFLFYEVQCGWLYVEVFDPFRLEFCAWQEIWIYFLFFSMLISSYSRNIVEYVFFTFYIFCFFVKNQVFVGVWIDIWVFYSVPLVLLSVLMPIPGCFQYCSSVVEFDIRDCDTQVPLLYRLSCVFCFSI